MAKTQADRNIEPVAPGLARFIRLMVDVGSPVSVGSHPNGERKLIPITGGTVSGEISGKILSGGSDALVIRPDGCAELDARYCVQTDQEETIFIHDVGFRHGPPAIMKKLARGEAVDPATYYFRTCMRLETAAPRHQWLNKTLFIGSGCRGPKHVIIDLFQVQ